MIAATSQMRRNAPAIRTLTARVAAAVLCGVLFSLSVRASESSGAPDLRGYWRPAQAYKLLKTREGQPPPFTPAAREVYEHNLAQRQKKDLSFDTMTTLCQLPGIPRALTASPFWLLQSNDYVTFVFDRNQVRQSVHIQGEHPTVDFFAQGNDQVYPMGSAAGKWDGKDLVIDSKQYNEKTLLDDATPHSESLQLVEHLHLVDHNTLEDVISVTDPETFTAPWTTVLRFKRLSENTPVSEDVCTDRVVTPQTVDAN